MRRHGTALPALLGGVALLGIMAIPAAPAVAQEPADKPIPTITVTGHASVSAVPDTVVITAGVATQRSRAVDAAAENSRVAQKLIDAVKAAGIEPKDIQTDSVGLEAVYDTPAKGSPHLTGYRASLSLHVRVKPIDKAGALISALTDAGANSIDGVEFVVSPDAQRDDRLRADAARDAKHQAETYTEAIGLKLGRVLLIAPGDTAVPELPRYDVRARMAAVAAPAPPVPLSAGEQQQQANVSVTFEIVQ